MTVWSKKILLPFLVAFLSAGISLTGFAEVLSWDSWVYEEEEDDEDEDDEDSSSSSSSSSGSSGKWSWSDSDVTTGPGAIKETEESGPTVVQSSLKETYHADFKTYEEALGNLFFMYTNVANGGITNEAVTLDIPANISYSIEKDGAAWEYVSGQAIWERGTYVMKLCAIDDPTLPEEQQQEYRAVFRFRIQEKPPEETEAETTPETKAASVGTANVTDLTGYVNGEMPLTEETVAESEPEELPEEETEAAEDEGEASEAETDAEETDVDEVSLPVMSGTAVSSEAPEQSYDTASSRYLLTFESGVSLLSNVPEGYVGPGSVELTVEAEDAEQVQLYRNDEAIEYVRGDSLTTEGSYRLMSGGQAFSFTIMKAVNQTLMLPAPAGMRYTAVTLNGAAYSDFDEYHVTLEQEGEYQLTLEGESGETLSVSLRKDTTPPEVLVTVDSTGAQIRYVSEDIADIELSKDGNIQEGFAGTSLSDPGSYVLTVTDEAGNQSSTSFQVSYRINTYAIVAIVIVVLIIAGIAGFVLYTKRTIRIR
ncbi:MAG: hypothetical protein LUE86_01985 [Clostridiales bacterium]|nr:hypothetical protein [Clostridiales bacterium]